MSNNPGQTTVTGILAAYAGGTIRALFERQGGGVPVPGSVGTTLDDNGAFSLIVWDNTDALYTPSQTQFILTLGSTTFSTTITVTSSSGDISSAFAAAPTPPSATGVPSVNGIADAVTVAPGANITVTTAGDTITIAGTVGPKNPDQGSATASGTFSTITLGTAPIAKSAAISINGLILDPATAYTITGSAITLTTPGAITNVVVVSWMTASTPTGSIVLS